MKKIILLVVLAAACQGVFLAAQETTEIYRESDHYYHSFSIEKIYSHRLGFMITYRKGGSNQMGRTFVPVEWFQTMGGKGEIVYLASGKEWPSMAIYYKNGEFSHVRLRLRRERTHESWGVIPFTANYDNYFQNIDGLKMEF
jgi:hypothetical protein